MRRGPARIHRTYTWWSHGRVSQQHGSQQITQESVAQLRQLDRAACVICGTIRSRRGSRCNHCKTASRDINVGDVFQDRRQPGHQSATSRPTPHQPSPKGSQRIAQGDPLGDSPLHRKAQPGTSLSQIIPRRCSSTSTPPRWQRALREPSTATGPGPSCAEIAADYCWRKFLMGPTETQN